LKLEFVNCLEANSKFPPSCLSAKTGDALAVTQWQSEFFKEADGTYPTGGMAIGNLAVSMRPRRLSEVVGQEHILGEGCTLPLLVRRNCFGSLIFFGPPGCGKTSLAEAIAAETGGNIFRLNGATANLSELRDILRRARMAERPPIVFIDEIHRFNRAQQDSLLPDVETGTVRLIGATTYAPTAYVIPALLSRSHLFRLKPLSAEVVCNFLRRALEDCERGLGTLRCSATDELIGAIAAHCQGDLRRSLNAIEMLAMGTPAGSTVGLAEWKAFSAERYGTYDRDGDEHYATISAHIKSMRGCDPDGAIYWLAKMLRCGEDPRFIGRRLVIFASEDVGLADPNALALAVACQRCCESIGMPECAINLAHLTVYLATAPKSNSANAAYGYALEDMKKNGMQPVPNHLRNQSPHLLRPIAVDDESYAYAHDYEHNITGQAHMAEEKQFYFPKKEGAEAEIAERMESIRRLREAMRSQPSEAPRKKPVDL
jgi:putative ATPase